MRLGSGERIQIQRDCRADDVFIGPPCVWSVFERVRGSSGGAVISRDGVLRVWLVKPVPFNQQVMV